MGKSLIRMGTPPMILAWNFLKPEGIEPQGMFAKFMEASMGRGLSRRNSPAEATTPEKEEGRLPMDHIIGGEVEA